MILGIPSLMVARGRKAGDTMYWDTLDQVSADVSVTSLSLVDVTGLSRSLLTNKAYEIEVVLMGTAGADGAGGKFSLNYTGTTATTNIFEVWQTTAATTSSVTANQFGTGATAAWASTTADHIAIIRAVFRTTSAGNLTVQALKVTSGTLTIRAGSILKMRALT